jgi:hypothetical protein
MGHRHSIAFAIIRRIALLVFPTRAMNVIVTVSRGKEAT